MSNLAHKIPAPVSKRGGFRLRDNSHLYGMQVWDKRGLPISNNNALQVTPCREESETEESDGFPRLSWPFISRLDDSTPDRPTEEG